MGRPGKRKLNIVILGILAVKRLRVVRVACLARRTVLGQVCRTVSIAFFRIVLRLLIINTRNGEVDTVVRNHSNWGKHFLVRVH